MNEQLDKMAGRNGAGKDNADATGGHTAGRYWTDYPLAEFGDAPNVPAQKRDASPVAYDGDKYVTCLVFGQPVEFKAGYLYDRERQGKPILRGELHKLPLPAAIARATGATP